MAQGQVPVAVLVPAVPVGWARYYGTLNHGTDELPIVSAGGRAQQYYACMHD